MRKYIALIMAFLLLLSATGCQGDLAKATAPELLTPVDVEWDTAVVEKGDVYDVTMYPGSVIPHVENVTFGVDGKLNALLVMVGDTVKKGQVIATLDDSSARKQIETLEAKILDKKTLASFSDGKAEADIAIAKAELAIMKENGSTAEACKIKQIDIEILQAKLRQTQELRNLELKQMEDELAELKANAVGGDLIAPIDGQIIYSCGDGFGDTIRANEVVFCIADINQLYVSTDDAIDEEKIATASKIYAITEVGEKELTYLPYREEERLTAGLTGVALKSRFQAKGSDLEAGLYAAVMVVENLREDVLKIPVNCLYQDRTSHYVYKVVGEQRIRCDVKIGTSSSIDVEILEGIQEGDVVYVKE